VSESVVADFKARFAIDQGNVEPVQGRVLLSQRRLVLAHGDGKVTVPLSAVFDVAVGDVPQAAEPFFDDTVTIGYRKDGDRHATYIEATNDAVDRFSQLLYKVLLDDTKAAIKHPARVGGRVTDASARRTKLHLTADGIACPTTDETVRIGLESIVHFARERRSVGDDTRPVLSIRHTGGGRIVTTELSVASRDKMNILGRYLRQEYSEVMAEIRDIELTTEEKEVLVGIYSGGSGADLAGLLGMESSQLSMVLNGLVEKGLVADGEATSLTGKGRMVVSDQIEDVNV
jgi:helix-turn-helix protein